MPISTVLSKITGAALDLLMPLRCVVCNREGQLVCETCAHLLPRLDEPFCNVCADPGIDGLCDWCATHPSAIDGIRSPFLMQGPIRKLVYDLKYRSQPHEHWHRMRR